MARGGLIGAGIFFLIIAIIAYYFPMSITLAGENFDVTIPQLIAFCESGLGQFAQLSPEMVMVCSEYNTLMLGFYGSGLLGIILVIVGAATSAKKESSTVCSHCNFVGKTEADLLDHKTKNHLDKSPYKCGKCDFIGITEEILWNHYNDKHPDKKKW